MKISDLLFGVLIALLGVSVVAYAGSLPGVPGHHYGPGLFPRVIGWSFIACGGMLALSGLRRGERLAGMVDWPDWRGSPRGFVQVGLMAAAMVAFVSFGDLLGFRLVAFCTLAAMYLVAGRAWWFALPVAALVSIGLNALFVNLLGVPLPVGELPWLRS